MAQTSPHQVVLSDEQRRELERRAAAYSGPYRDVVRAKAILLAAEGLSNTEIAERLGAVAPGGLDVAKTVLRGGAARSRGETAAGSAAAFFPRRRWPRSRRWRASCRPSRAFRSRAGRALSSPGRRSSAGSSRRSRRSRSGGGLRRTRSARGTTARGSSRATRSSRRRPAGCSICTRVAGRGSCCSPATSSCAPMRSRRSKPARASTPASPRRPAGDGQLVEHEYERKGALCYLAAWDVRRARLFDRCAPKDGIVPFDQLVEQFMIQRALPQGAARVRDRRQRLRAPRPALDRPPPRRLAEPDPGSHAGPRQLAQPGRDLLLGRATQGAATQRLPRPRHPRANAATRSAATTSRSPNRSSGSSPAKTSTSSSSDSSSPPTTSARRMTESVNGLEKTTT